MTKLRILLLLLICPLLANARLRASQLADSLMRRVPYATEDSNKVKLLDTLAVVFHVINPDSGISYGEWGLRTAQMIQWKRGIGKAYNALGLNYEAKTQTTEALDYYQRAVRVFEEIGDKRAMANSVGNIGNVYRSLSKFQKAIEFDSTALAMYEQLKDADGQLRNLGNMAVVYQQMEDGKRAHQFFTMAINLAIRQHNDEEYAKNLGNLSILNVSENNLKEAIKNASTAVDLYAQNPEFDRKGLASNMANLGEFYLDYSEDSTLPAAERAQLLRKSIDALTRTIGLLRPLQYNEGLIDCYQTLSRALESAGNYKDAIVYLKASDALRDSVFPKEVSLKIAKLEAENQAENKKRQILLETIKKRDERIGYITAVALLLLIMGIVTRNFVKQIQSNKKLAKEKSKHLKKLEVQSNVLMDIAHIQSHEIRGPVSTIMGLAQLFNYDDLSDPVNRELMEGIGTLANRLDKIVTDVVNRENKLNKDDAELDDNE
ncbi:MAG: hypothetical protein EBZ77_00435 [Chitinophagia bacterium]|nr:hypothetical protein [Chitinophagia bacterium]